jgi:hypothetical protein
MNSKQQAAKTAINQLAIELIALVDQQHETTEFDISVIRKLSDRISYEVNDLNDYEALEELFETA